MQNIESTIGLELEAAAAAAAGRSHRRARGGGLQTMECAPMSLLVFACLQVPPPPRCRRRRRRRPLRLLPLPLLLLFPPTIWATSFNPFSGPDRCGTSFRTSCTALQFDESYRKRLGPYYPSLRSASGWVPHVISKTRMWTSFGDLVNAATWDRQRPSSLLSFWDRIWDRQTDP